MKKGEIYMSKSKLTFKRNITDRLSVKGILSEDGTYITYSDENDSDQDIKVTDLLKVFVNQPCLKSDEDLDLVASDEE